MPVGCHLWRLLELQALDCGERQGDLSAAGSFDYPALRRRQQAAGMGREQENSHVALSALTLTSSPLPPSLFEWVKESRSERRQSNRRQFFTLAAFYIYVSSSGHVDGEKENYGHGSRKREERM